MRREKITDAYNALFDVLAKREGQKPILFGRIESEPIALKAQGDILYLHNSSIMNKSHVT